MMMTKAKHPKPEAAAPHPAAEPPSEAMPDYSPAHHAALPDEPRAVKRPAAFAAVPQERPPAPPPVPPATPLMKPAGAPRHPEIDEAELEQELTTIYGEAADKPDMTRFTQAKSSTAKKILVGLIVFFSFLAAVSWAGFFFFSPTDDKFSGEGVEIAIDGPPQVKSGDLVAYTVNWKNGERVPLGTASLEFRLPREFVILNTEPAPDGETEQKSWRLGSLAPDKTGSVTVQGVFVAPLDQQLDLQAILTYRPADFNSEFQKVTTRAIGIADSVLELATAGPAKVMPGDKVTLDFSYINTSENEFRGVRFRVAYPPGFIPETAEPAALGDAKNEWDLGVVQPNTQQHVKVTGAFASDAKGQLEVKSQIGFLDTNEDFQLQKEATFTTEVLEGQLVVSLILNGKNTEQPVAFGDTLHYAMSWRNTGNVDLEDVTLAVAFETQPDPERVLQWNGLRDQQEGVRDRNRITWTKKQVTALGRVRPDDEGTIDFDLPVLAAPLADLKSADYRVTAWVEANIKTIDGEMVNRTTQTPPFAAVVFSDAKFAAAARYYDANGAAIGSGPLPPKVGQATTYRVYWQLDNTLHDLTDLKLSARLPDNASWTGRSTVDAGTLTFDAAEAKIVWTLNWLPTTIRTLKLNFDLSLTPTADQNGKVPTLVDAAIFEAKDKATGAAVILSAPPLTTALDGDDLASGKGRVQP